MSVGGKDGMVPHPPMGHHTKVVHRWNRLAKAAIWLAATITLSTLVLIVGYIFVNGFYTRSTVQLPVREDATETITVDTEAGEQAIALVVSRSLRLRTTDFDTLHNLLTGSTEYWGFITGQDRRVSVIILDDGTELARSVFDHFRISTDNGLADTVTVVSSPQAIEQAIAEHKGSLAIIPADLRGEFSGVRQVSVRETSVAVHPDVIQLVDGRRVSAVPEETLTQILDGTIRDWNRVRGTDTMPEPIVVVALDGDNERHADVEVATTEELVHAIQTIPGAIGLVPRRDTLHRDVSVLDVQFTIHSANLRPSFFLERPSKAGEVGGINSIIVNTLIMILFVLMIATPIGIAAAIYLVEYARQGPLLMVLRVGTDTLAGIPSIIFGLFGMVFFAQFLGLQTGLLSGSLTLTIMILPTLVRTSEEALRSVPDTLREGSLALGATKIQTLFRVVLPAAAPGVLTGVVLGIGRAIGETAAVLFTMGSNLALIRSLNSPMRVLSVHLYMLVRETISIPNAFATATILVLIVLIVNTVARQLIGRTNPDAVT